CLTELTAVFGGGLWQRPARRERLRPLAVRRPVPRTVELLVGSEEQGYQRLTSVWLKLQQSHRGVHLDGRQGPDHGLGILRARFGYSIVQHQRRSGGLQRLHSRYPAVHCVERLVEFLGGRPDLFVSPSRPGTGRYDVRRCSPQFFDQPIRKPDWRHEHGRLGQSELIRLLDKLQEWDAQRHWHDDGGRPTR